VALAFEAAVPAAAAAAAAALVVDVAVVRAGQVL